MGTRHRARRRGAARPFAVLLVVACALLAIEVVLLALENRRLKEVLASEIGRATATSSILLERERLVAGDLLAPFHVVAPGGAVEAVDLAAGRTLLLVFAEQCPACPKVVPAWERLVPRARAAGAAVLGLQLDPGTAAAPGSPGGPAGAVAGLDVPVRRLHDVREVPLAKLTTVPLTALLDESGSAVWVRYGVLGEADLAELEQLLDGA